MSAEYVLMKGNEAIAEAALRAGCRFYAGYPITPQSEILEYMSVNMEKRGGLRRALHEQLLRPGL